MKQLTLQIMILLLLLGAEALGQEVTTGSVYRLEYYLDFGPDDPPPKWIRILPQTTGTIQATIVLDSGDIVTLGEDGRYHFAPPTSSTIDLDAPCSFTLGLTRATQEFMELAQSDAPITQVMQALYLCYLAEVELKYNIAVIKKAKILPLRAWDIWLKDYRLAKLGAASWLDVRALEQIYKSYFVR